VVERGNKVGGRWGRRERADGMQKQVSNFEQTRVTSCWHALLAADMLYEQVSNFEQTVDWRHFSRQSKTIARHAAHQRQGGGGGEDEELHMLMCEEGDGGSVANTGAVRN
jgi:hypothetical protein